MSDSYVLMLPCDCCDGGWVEGAPYSYDPRNGDPICRYSRCSCNGQLVPVEHALITETDFEDCFPVEEGSTNG